MIYDCIIIGGGPAGMTASLYLLRNNKKVLILEKENFGGQISISPKVENFPTIKSISGLELSDLMFSQIDSLGAEFELEEAISISKNEDIFEIKTNYNTYLAKTIINATGVSHRKIGLPHEDELVGSGVSYCAVCDGPFYKGQEVYLIGDANSALQYALLLSDYCLKVHIITLFDKFFGDEILIDKVLSKENIDVTHHLNLVEFLTENESLSGLKFIDTKTNEERIYRTNNVFIAIGQVPHNEIFKDFVELDKGFVVTNEKMETLTKGLYAIGDARKKDVRQALTACNDGAIAAVEIVKYLQ